MYKILFVSALSWELKPIKDKIKKLNIPNLKIDFFTTWMWNYNMILHLTRYLVDKDYDFIVNIWTCWYKGLNDNIYQVWQIINIQNNKELLVPINIKIFHLVSCYCFDKPVKKLDTKFCLVDMESYGFEIVADNFLLPRLILKIPVDNIWEKFDKDLFLRNLNDIDFKKVLESIKLYLKDKPKKQKLDKYINHFKFTFSQKQIFKRLYNKYLALKDNNFDSFYEHNKNSDRKNFLTKLDNILDI